ncbi:MAG TPA: nicotinate phosphoribosyltransferase [Candidatus Acidoferrum sp.]|nr:nicotinate phosphoribosyltransferase [Candidatus Acidoferrum sp.]
MKAAFKPLPGARALLTDLYQLTMAYGYWKTGRADQEAVFHLVFRQHPFRGGFTLACGLTDCIRYLRGFRFEKSDLDYLEQLKGNDGRRLFEPAFLKYLGKLRLRLDVDAIPEGTVVFPQEPLVRVRGPILQAQLVETALLNLVNFQSLIATKAARVCLAAQGDPVVEFGLRRAQGIDGALTASRSAYIGGCAGTSNVLAGKMFGIPVKGTHAHSWVMAFETELEAFNAYADALPNNCIFLVDTYETIEGVRRAVEAGKRLRKHGHKLVGIRLDSGDLAYLSIEARKILNAAGFKDAVIVASNDLDEHLIASLKQQRAAINMWGVGTMLVTAYDQPALGGVYKLSAIRKPDGTWGHRVKLSEQTAKVTNPGVLQVRRFRKGNEFVGDAIYDETRPFPRTMTIVDPIDATRRKHFSAEAKFEDLLVPILRHGKVVYDSPSLESIRARAQKQVSMLHPGIRRFDNPHQYPAGLEATLHQFKTELIVRARGGISNQNDPLGGHR